jgi:2'-5' RNA ligase
LKPAGGTPSDRQASARSSLRAFVGIPLPQAGIAEYVAAQRALAGVGDVKWVEPGNLHLTLKFLGRIERTSVPRLVETLGRCAVRAAAAELHARLVTAFPNARAARVLVVELEDSAGAVRRLQADVDRELRSLGYPPEERPFRTHVTLGRVRNGRSDARAGLAAALPPASIWRVDAFELIESRLSPSGPAYATLRSFRVGAP